LRIDRKEKERKRKGFSSSRVSSPRALLHRAGKREKEEEEADLPGGKKEGTLDLITASSQRLLWLKTEGGLYGRGRKVLIIMRNTP